MSAAEKLEVQTTDLVVISSTPAAIAFNFEETRDWLENELKQYDVVVTADTLAGSKKLATELNKLAAEISKRRRDAVAEVSAPIKLFEDQAKSLEQMCKDGRQKLLDQVKTFEDETRKKAEELLIAHRLDQWDRHQIEPEFRKAEYADLVKLTALTKTGKLAASVISEMQIRIMADKSQQERVKMRLVQLENHSYRAGLSAPLTRAHVETFLLMPDEEYQARLDDMLRSELEREKVAQERMRQKMEAEAKAKAEREFHEEQQRRHYEDQRIKQEQEAHDEKLVHEHVRRMEQAAQPEPDQQPEPEYVVEKCQRPGLNTATNAASKYAYGPLQDPRSAVVVTSTLAEVEQDALLLDQQPIGIWVPGQLVAIVYGGEVFRKVL